MQKKDPLLPFQLRGLTWVVLTLSILCSHSQGRDTEEFKEVISRMKPYAGNHQVGVDSSTLKGKVMCGYQGWFAAEGDGSNRGWTHYATRRNVLKPGHCTLDLWPDMSEMDSGEKFATAFKHKDGNTAYLFSSYKRKTVLRHFRWMKEYGIDGVFLQRFGSSLKSARSYNHRNVVTANVQAGANQHGRTWSIMYDLSGLRAGEIEKYVIEDWKRLVDRMKIKKDKSYLHHKGSPVVAVWGIGFKGERKYSLDECERLVSFLKDDKKYGGNTVMLGVPTGWRNLERDSVKDKKLHAIILKADIISPWTVGRYSSQAGVKKHRDAIVKPDIKWTKQNNLEYLPVAFPGFSWQNLQKTHKKEVRLDQIPRRKGQFLWSQAVEFKKAGGEMLYVAMFDEIDEGTAIFKCTNDPPVGESRFLTYDGLPSDHYLWLTGKIGALLCGDIAASKKMPVRPTTSDS